MNRGASFVKGLEVRNVYMGYDYIQMAELASYRVDLALAELVASKAEIVASRVEIEAALATRYIFYKEFPYHTYLRYEIKLSEYELIDTSPGDGVVGFL